MSNPILKLDWKKISFTEDAYQLQLPMQLGYPLSHIYERKIINPQKELILTKDEIKLIGTDDKDGLQESKDSFRGINIILLEMDQEKNMIILGDGTKTMGTNFAYLLRVAELGGAVQQLKDVTWKPVENALENLKISSSGGFLELSDKDDTTTMIVFGESGKFHIGIIIDEEVYFYYWNGIEPVEDRVVPLAGNFFKEHQICHDFNLAKKIIKYFYETGRPLESVLWEKEVV